MTVQLVDSHCHLNMLDLSTYPQGMDEVLANAAQLGVEHMLCVAVDLIHLPEVMQFAIQYPHVFASVGVHPTEVGAEPNVAQLLDLASHTKVVAIGETGLDYYREGCDIASQQQRFRDHIQVSKQLAKPLIVHTRQARADTLAILRAEGASEIGGVLHCFTEDWDMASAALDLNFYISFSGILTFRNALELQAIAKRLPLERILIETDAPYLTPVPYRGKPNQPGYTRYVAEFLADLRQEPLEKIAAQTTANFFQLFKQAKPSIAACVKD
jgi:TatD DNase family protein